MNGPRAWLAEGLSTYALVFFGSISVILAVAVYGDGSLSSEGVLLIGLVHGGIIGMMVYAFGSISGAHINPAVTIPMVITKHLSPKEGVIYIIAQLVGAILGSATMAIIMPGLAEQVAYAGHTGPSELLNGSIASGFLVEIILTFFLVLTIFMVAVHKRAAQGWAGFTIGGIVVLIHLVGVPLTGASVNPARSFGPAIFSGAWEFQWMYWVAPIIGGILGGVIINHLYVKHAENEKLN